MSKIGLQIEITAPGGVPPSIPSTAAAIKALNREMQRSLDIERQKHGKFSGTAQIVLEETRAKRLRERAQEVLSGFGGASPASPLPPKPARPSWSGMAGAIDAAAPKIERAAHSMALLKIAAETESFQAALEKLGPSFKSLFNDITTGLTGAVFAAQGVRDIASLTKGMTAAQGWTAGAAGVGLIGVALMKVSADAAVAMSDAQGDENRSVNGLFDVANARAKSVQTSEQLTALIEGIQADSNSLYAQGNSAQAAQMKELAHSLLGNREAVLERNRKAAGEAAAAEEAKVRDELIRSSADAWGEAVAALDEATAAAKREALARQPLAVQIEAAQKDLEKARALSERHLAGWKKTLDESGVDEQTKEDSLSAKKASLQLPVVKAQAALDELRSREGTTMYGTKADFMAHVRGKLADGWDGSANKKAKAEPVVSRSFRLAGDSAIQQGLAVGNVRSSLDVSSRTVALLQGILDATKANKPVPGSPTTAVAAP